MLWWNRISEFPPQLNRRITIRKISADFSLAEFFWRTFGGGKKYGGYGYRRRLRGLLTCEENNDTTYNNNINNNKNIH